MATGTAFFSSITAVTISSHTSRSNPPPCTCAWYPCETTSLQLASIKLNTRTPCTNCSGSMATSSFTQLRSSSDASEPFSRISPASTNNFTNEARSFHVMFGMRNTPCDAALLRIPATASPPGYLPHSATHTKASRSAPPRTSAISVPFPSSGSKSKGTSTLDASCCFRLVSTPVCWEIPRTVVNRVCARTSPLGEKGFDAAASAAARLRRFTLPSSLLITAVSAALLMIAHRTSRWVLSP
mmetsp:Transcript_43732/g.52891  ORF Transcript_43732/g.52891 Transcript_43732/m.52891 type:complete len:241 (-) Transcript_43732:815-1537(-)